MFSIPALLAPAVMAQASQPAISDAGSGSIPSELGMYVQAGDGFNKILGQIVAFTRSGSLLVSGLTAGIKTRKQNVQLLGPHAQTVINGKPVFYFIPPRQEADAGVNAGDLVLVRLEEKAERRQFEIGAQGLARASSGISITHQIQLIRSEAKPGIYTITPALELGKGEYALYLARGEGMQAYVYDFSVSSSCCALTRPGGEVETLSRVQSPSTTLPARVTAGGLGDAVTNSTDLARYTGEATAEISSDPLGADIEIDGNFVGSTPSSVGIVAGEHTLRVSKSGYRRWERTLKSSTGKIKIAARLEPIPIDASATSHPPTEVAAIRDPDPPANSSEGVVEEARIGIWLTGNPTTRHDGIEISGVQPEGPAASIGIQAGDLILAIDGHYLYSIDDLRSDLLRHERGARLAIRYRHGRLTYDNYLVLASNSGPSVR
jgi:membrane-associated protease RseP (regulator of RpoE activity)